MPRILKATRSQLAEFIKDHKTIKEFENLFGQNNDLALLIIEVIKSLGIGTDGIYTTRVGSAYLDSSTNMFNDSTLLDTATFTYTREAISIITTDAGVLPVAQTVLCDTTLGNINVTLPPPLSCFSDNRSLRFAIHKTDTSSNTVTILPNATELIVGEVSQELLMDGEIYNFITDGINWYLGA